MLVRHELLPFCLLHVARSGRNSISGAASFAISPRPRDHSCERPIGAPQSVLPVPQTTLFPAHDKHSDSAGFPGRRARGLSKPGGQARVPGPALCARWRIRISGAVGPGPRSAASGVPRCQCVGARRESQQAQPGLGKKGKVGARVQRSSTIICATPMGTPRQDLQRGRSPGRADCAGSLSCPAQPSNLQNQQNLVPTPSRGLASLRGRSTAERRCEQHRALRRAAGCAVSLWRADARTMGRRSGGSCTPTFGSMHTSQQDLRHCVVAQRCPAPSVRVLLETGGARGLARQYRRTAARWRRLHRCAQQTGLRSGGPHHTPTRQSRRPSPPSKRTKASYPRPRSGPVTASSALRRPDSVSLQAAHTGSGPPARAQNGRAREHRFPAPRAAFQHASPPRSSPSSVPSSPAAAPRRPRGVVPVGYSSTAPDNRELGSFCTARYSGVQIGWRSRIFCRQGEGRFKIQFSQKLPEIWYQISRKAINRPADLSVHGTTNTVAG